MKRACPSSSCRLTSSASQSAGSNRRRRCSNTGCHCGDDSRHRRGAQVAGRSTAQSTARPSRGARHGWRQRSDGDGQREADGDEPEAFHYERIISDRLDHDCCGFTRHNLAGGSTRCGSCGKWRDIRSLISSANIAAHAEQSSAIASPLPSLRPHDARDLHLGEQCCGSHLTDRSGCG